MLHKLHIHTFKTWPAPPDQFPLLGKQFLVCVLTVIPYNWRPSIKTMSLTCTSTYINHVNNKLYLPEYIQILYTVHCKNLRTTWSKWTMPLTRPGYMPNRMLGCTGPCQKLNIIFFSLFGYLIRFCLILITDLYSVVELLFTK